MDNPSTLTLGERFHARALSDIAEGLSCLTQAVLLLGASPESDRLVELIRSAREIEAKLRGDK